MKKNIHIGSIIYQKVKERKVRISELSEKLHCCNRNVYDIFKRDKIDVERLDILSELLDYDFNKIYYPDRQQEQKFLALIKVSEEKLKELSTDKNIEIKTSEKL
ncbi:hypothetical protein FACS189429_5180 [Bacteroidia bacterium]|nr:hypothetical protein FACS189429_5180 [Bacteroidia bacterium]GHV46822.1 hypothetical protein FACS1894180_9470 [Bacteroidia bacterium]